MRIKSFIAIFTLFIFLWFIPSPEGLSTDAWHIFSIFLFTILGIMLEVMPIGAMGLIGITLVATSDVTKSLPGSSISNALSFLSSSFVWLIVLATLLSKAIIKTGLGGRISFILLKFFGKSTLGTGYALAISELILAPFTPSNTARGGSIIHPIMKSIANSLDSTPYSDKRFKVGRFLAMVNYNTNPITSAMFITATAPNPIIVSIVDNITKGAIHLSWLQWSLAMILPGLISILVMPLIISIVYPPSIKRSKDIKKLASEELSKLGKLSLNETIVLSIFIFLIIFWTKIPDFLFGFGLDTTTTILVGIVILVVTNILKWDEVLTEKGAWSNLIWFSALIMLASYLNRLGFISWFSNNINIFIINFNINKNIAQIFVVLIYMYSHYIFASTTAHITAMFAIFYTIGLSLGADQLHYALLLAGVSSIMMHLTHYATGTSPIIYSSGYITTKEWWIIGFILSLTSLLIFAIVGSFWWKLIF